MKRLFYISAIFLCLSGCSEKPTDNIGASGESNLNTYTVDAAIDDETKANIDETTLQVLWQKGDVIGLVDEAGNIISAVLMEEYDGNSIGRFTYQAESEVDVKFAFYPYTGAETTEGTLLNISLPTVQRYAASGIIDRNTLIMSGVAKDNMLVFKNACAIAMLKVKGEPNYVDRLCLRSDVSKLTGKGTLDMSADLPVWKPSSEQAVGYVELDMEGRRLKMSADEYIVGYVVVPAGDLVRPEVESFGNVDEHGNAVDKEVSLYYKSQKDILLNPGKIRPLSATLSFPADATIYGKVLCGGIPVPGVQVTDGIEVVQTDSDGAYILDSEKKNGMVYISIPSGYTVRREYGAIPKFFHHTVKDATAAERIDFELFDDGDQTNHMMLFFGDIHIHGSSNEAKHFGRFIDEVNKYIKENPSSKIYAMTLGDMTWDYFWYQNNVGIPEYLKYTDLFVPSLNVFSTMGNHDNDMEILYDDWGCISQWRKYYGPNYYSLNIGNVHYVSLDNVYTENQGGKDGRKFTQKLSDELVLWLEKDLAAVDVSTPVVVAMHLPLFNYYGSDDTSGAPDIVKYFAKFDDLKFISAHTHTVYNNKKAVQRLNPFFYRANVEESNAGAVCADFWASGRYDENLLLCTDGAPAGYRLMKVNGKEMQLTYKAIDKTNSLFRAYDRNSINIDPAVYIPAAGEVHKSEFMKYVGNFEGESADNYIYVFVYDYKDGYDISVTEEGNSLAVTMVQEYDPLYNIAVSAKRCNTSVNDDGFVLSTHPVLCRTVFRTQATTINSTVRITVTDPYGNSFTEEMKRPKTFSITSYAKENVFHNSSVSGNLEEFEASDGSSSLGQIEEFNEIEGNMSHDFDF